MVKRAKQLIGKINLMGKLSKLTPTHSFIVIFAIVCFSGAILLLNFDKVFGYATGQKVEKYATKVEVGNLSDNIADKVVEIYSVMSEKNTIQNNQIQKNQDFQGVIMVKLDEMQAALKNQNNLLKLIIKHSAKSREILEEYQLNNLTTNSQ